jgi:LysM repeat protein
MDLESPSIQPARRGFRRLLAAVSGIALGAVVVAVVLLLSRGPRPIDHVVVRGDTLGAIAAEHGVTVDELRTWNGLEGDLIEVGQVLRIHAGAAAPAPAPRRGARRRPGAATSSPAGRVLPPEQPCLPPPDPDTLQAGDEPAYLASLGLNQGQVEAAMNAFLPALFDCVPSGDEPNGVLELELAVACTGRVAAVRVLDRGGLPEPLVACSADTLRYAPFPAHDLPDGFVFRYPVRFEW